MWSRSLRGGTVTAVGVGDLSVACAASRGLDAGDVQRALHGALDAGIELIDLAAEDAAERIAGEAVRALRARDRVVTATSVPTIVDRGGRTSQDVLAARLPPRYVQDRVEASLRATRLEVLPLVQLPLRAAWRSCSAWSELRGACDRLVREGKVLDWGARVDVLEEDSHELVGEPWFASISVPFSLCERAAEPLLAAAAEARIAVFARRPLAGGGLAGSLGPGVRLRPGDDRLTITPAQLETMAVGVAKLAAFVSHEPVAARSCEPAKAQLARNLRPDDVQCATVAELALRFVIDRGAIALPRLHRHAHIAEAVRAASAPPLSAAALAAIDL